MPKFRVFATKEIEYSMDIEAENKYKAQDIAIETPIGHTKGEFQWVEDSTDFNIYDISEIKPKKSKKNETDSK